MNAFSNQTLDAALTYAAKGWRVLPLYSIRNGQCSCGDRGCGNSGKHPLLAHGSKDATTDAGTIRNWFGAMFPDANIGIATGPESGIFLLGPDGEQGIADLAKLEKANSELPATPRARSGGGGRHYLFRYPQGHTVANRRNHRGTKIDVRGQGGYFIAAPSNHKSGTPYAWETNAIPPAEAPPWLLDWLGSNSETSTVDNKAAPVAYCTDAETVARAVAWLQEQGPAVSGNGGHDTAYTVARGLAYGWNLGPETGLRLLLQHYNSKCVPPWSERELRHKCIDADTKPCDLPRGWLLEPVVEATDLMAGLAELNLLPGDAEDAGDDDEDIFDFTAWPTPPAPEAFYGLPGRLVNLILPASEADATSLLMQTLVAFGNVIGRSAYVQVEADRHYTNEFAVLVGATSKSRKGTSWGRIKALFGEIDSTWKASNIKGGLSSGEGLIHAVRDAVIKKDPVKEEKVVVRYQDVMVDQGVDDKRLLAVEPEFVNVLRQPERSGNTLSVYLRLAWDGESLQSLTKNSPLKSTEPLISIIGHITLMELRQFLTSTSAANGYGNRHLWVCVRRSKKLPLPVPIDPAAWQALVAEFNQAVSFGRVAKEVRMSKEATKLWCEIYESVDESGHGIAGALTARAEPHILRLGMLHALTGKTDTIQPQHLLAARALVDYASRSVRYIFGNVLGDNVAEKIYDALCNAPGGMLKTDLHMLFNRNLGQARLNQALALLMQAGMTRKGQDPPAGERGRPGERWFAVRRKKRASVNP
jgi:hypothetical protein